jgi:hypothetical protein
MSDERPFYEPHQPPAAPRKAQVGDLLFEFHVPSTQTFWRVELRDHGAYGVDSQTVREAQPSRGDGDRGSK